MRSATPNAQVALKGRQSSLRILRRSKPSHQHTRVPAFSRFWISGFSTVIQRERRPPGVYCTASVAVPWAVRMVYTSDRSGRPTLFIPVGHVPVLQMLTASQLCPVPSPPPPLEYAMASAVNVLKHSISQTPPAVITAKDSD